MTRDARRTTKQIALAEIRIDGGTQSRASLNQQTIEDYADEMRDGVQFPQAVYCLRERLIANKGSKAKLRPVDILALTFKAWNHARNGDNVRYLRWRTEGDTPEDFPSIETPAPSKRAAKAVAK